MLNHEVRVWYNPELKSSNFMVPGVICLILTVMTMILGSVSLVKEQEQGTMEQLIVTPIKGWELILGKILPFVVIGYVDIIIILLVGCFWFKVPIMGSIPLLLGLSGLFLLNTLGLGLFISTISRTQQQAMMTAFFFMMPFVLLSGFIFPIANMPEFIQYLTYLVPLRYFLVIIRGICLKGVGLPVLLPEVIPLVLLGLGIFALSVARFHKKLE
ncbi:MAG: ABC transporter permease [Candidatus Desantisbacteria bacterium]